MGIMIFQCWALMFIVGLICFLLDYLIWEKIRDPYLMYLIMLITMMVYPSGFVGGDVYAFWLIVLGMNVLIGYLIMWVNGVLDEVVELESIFMLAMMIICIGPADFALKITGLIRRI